MEAANDFELAHRPAEVSMCQASRGWKIEAFRPLRHVHAPHVLSSYTVERV